MTPEGKTGLWKIEFEFGSQVSYWEGMVVSHRTPLSR